MASGTIERAITGLLLSEDTYDLSNITTQAPVDMVISQSRQSFNFFAFVFSPSSANPSSSRGSLVVPASVLVTGSCYPIVVNHELGWVRISTVSGDPYKIRVLEKSFSSLYCHYIHGIL